MSVFRPTVFGGVISVSDSASLATELSILGMPPGTRVWNIAVGAYFTLTTSTAALVANVVVAALGTTGARWIVAPAGAGTVESVNGDFVDNTDPANPVIDATTAIVAAMLDPADKAAITAFPNVATTSLQGMMSAADKLKLAQITTAIAGTGTPSVAPATTFPISGLDCNARGDLLISGTIVCDATGTPTFSLRLNGDSSNYIADFVVNGAGAPSSVLFINGLAASAGLTVSFRIVVSAKTGKYRKYTAEVFDLVGATHNGITVNGYWTNAVDNITSATIFCDTANGLQTGTIITAWYTGIAT